MSRRPRYIRDARGLKQLAVDAVSTQYYPILLHPSVRVVLPVNKRKLSKSRSTADFACRGYATILNRFQLLKAANWFTA